MSRGAALLPLLPALALAACDAGVQGRTGLDAMLRASGGTYVAGALPADSGAVGPTVAPITFNTRVFPGAQTKLGGSVQHGAVSVAIGLADDVAYWIVPAPTANRDIGAGDELLFSTTLSYSRDLAPGTHNLVLRALLPGGGLGPPYILVLTVAPGEVEPTGAMVVRLAWGANGASNADLDLHVVVPDTSKPGKTIEVWAKNPSSLPKRSVAEGPYSDEELAAGGQLDIDSNGGCAIDGRDLEHVVWGAAPPSGHYIARVDAVSMCGEAAAPWQLQVLVNSQVIGSAQGQMGDSDTRFSHTEGSGLLALEWDIP